METRLALYSVTDPANWPAACEASLAENGFMVRQRTSRRLDVWRPDAVQSAGGALYFVDGLAIDSCWVANGQNNIRIQPRRYYFDRSATAVPLALPEHRLLNGRPRRSTSASALIADAVECGEHLTAAGVAQPTAIEPDRLAEGLIDSTIGLGAKNATFALDQDLWKGLSGARAFSIPPGLKVMLIHSEQRPGIQVREYAQALEREWLPAVGLAPRPGVVRLASLAAVLPAIRAVRDGLRQGDFEDAVFLVAITGQPGQPLPAAQAEFLSILDKLALPYRCFSDQNRQAKWSARAQAVSILEGAGGIPYRLRLPRHEDLEDAILFGVDLGHATRYRKRSHIVVSVLDRYGQHVLSVRRTQRLNEAIDGALLRDLLKTARREALKRIDYPARRAVLFRDGLIPAGGSRALRSVESAALYREALALPLTLVELRKRGNPMIFRTRNGQHHPSHPGTACGTKGSDVRFFNAYAAPSGLPRTFKVRVVKGFDELDLGVDAAAALSVGLCYAPSLGLRPHLPGPIYWADGIASTREHTYKFAGQRMMREGYSG